MSVVEPSAHDLLTSSDHIVSCTCSSTSLTPSTGLVLLFYRYWAASPHLPSIHNHLTTDLKALQAFQISLTTTHNLGSKIRISTEGFNATVAGSRQDVKAYMHACARHWSFAGLGLEDVDGIGDEGVKGDKRSIQTKREFFKPTPGCRCVFPGPASVRITAEVTPLGITGYEPRDWEMVVELSPSDFHAICTASSAPPPSSTAPLPNSSQTPPKSPSHLVLLDLRNHYESRIGYFIHPGTGEPALRPAIRRFSQFPAFARRTFGGLTEAPPSSAPSRQFLTYCTGGVRCEKGARWLQEAVVGGGRGVQEEPREGDQVLTLKGGIAAYLAWMEGEMRAGRRGKEESLFKGRNYVFDGRGSVGLDVTNEEDDIPVSECHGCAVPCDRLGKCRERGCQLILVVCEACEGVDGGPSCCEGCAQLELLEDNKEGDRPKSRPLCPCEREREERLLGGGSNKLYPEKKQQRQKQERKRSNFLMRRQDVHVDVGTSVIIP